MTFDDGVMEVSGSWVVGRKPMTEPGIMISIMVDHADATMKLITKHGGKIVYTEKMGADEFVASFTDPAGNLMVIYESARLK